MMGAPGIKAGAFAALAPRLLARKGGARPAMRKGDHHDLESLASAQAALGWDDLGEGEGYPAAATSQSGPGRARLTLVGAAARAKAPPAGAASAKGAPRPAASRSRTAFTLRLEPDLRLRLRLASTLHGCSAQMLVIEALDRLLDDIPQLEAMAAQCGAHSGKA